MTTTTGVRFLVLLVPLALTEACGPHAASSPVEIANASSADATSASDAAVSTDADYPDGVVLTSP